MIFFYLYNIINIRNKDEGYQPFVIWSDIMTRKELIKALDKIREEIACCDETVTDYARERAYVDIVSAIEVLEENEKNYD